MSSRFTILVIHSEITPSASTLEPWLQSGVKSSKIVQVTSLSSALKQLRRQSYDAIIYRLKDRSKTNFDHLRVLAEAAPTTCLMALMKSSQYGEGLVDRALETGVSDFLISDELNHQSFSRLVGIGIKRKQLALGAVVVPTANSKLPPVVKAPEQRTGLTLAVGRKKVIRLCVLANDEAFCDELKQFLADIPCKMWTYTDLAVFSRDSKAQSFDVFLLVGYKADALRALPETVLRNLKEASTVLSGSEPEVEKMLLAGGFVEVIQVQDILAKSTGFCDTFLSLGFRAKERRVYLDLRSELLSKKQLLVAIRGDDEFFEVTKALIADLGWQITKLSAQACDICLQSEHYQEDSSKEPSVPEDKIVVVPLNKISIMQKLLEFLKDQI